MSSEVKNEPSRMASAVLPKVSAMAAAYLCQYFALTDEAKPLLEDNPDITTFLTRLIEKEYYLDAIRLLALALPKREAAWWACLSVRDSLTPKTPPTDIAALNAAENWVYKPTEENRRAASASAEATKFDTAAGWAAMAAFWTGGSMTPPNTPVVPPTDDLTGKAVGGAVLLAAAVSGDAEKIKEKQKKYLVQGIDIAKGGKGTL